MSTQQIIESWESGVEPYNATTVGCNYNNPNAIKIVECGCCSQYHRLSYSGDCRNDDERFADPEDFEARWNGGGYLSAEVSGA